MAARRPLARREIDLYRLFSNCRYGMTPQALRRKYLVSNLQIARIARVSEPTVERWFSSGANRSHPNATQLLMLGLMDLLWEHYEEIPTDLRELVCPPPNGASSSQTE
ncbi:MAG: helix-turn-helix domain-containing protein [Leptolyngbyaceae cyanobacterium SM1_3_5]|nr:helix-turn-helix domain-containing protein [Leptolyngbyaceae cyanobacterium SM1_3_5]